MGFVELTLGSLQFLPEVHYLLFLLLTPRAFTLGSAWRGLFQRVAAFLLLLSFLVGLDSGVELLFEIAATKWGGEYIVRSRSRAKLIVLHLVASSRIFLSFMPVPYNLLSKSSYDVSSLIQRISSCACCRADLPLGGLGGSGVYPFLESREEWEESSSE